MPGLEVTAGYSRRVHQGHPMHTLGALSHITMPFIPTFAHVTSARLKGRHHHPHSCLLYTSDAADECVNV